MRVPKAALQSTMPLKPTPEPKAGQVAMRTLRDCQLAVSVYPTFSYDARGGGGVAETSKQGSQRLELRFDPATLSIPDVGFRTARFLGLPLPPIFKIAIESRSLKGFLDRETGEVVLDFIAEFNFTTSFFSWVAYAAPPLLVTTRLTTGRAQGKRLSGTGTPIAADGHARLAGVALVPRTGDWFMDAFLRLPDETLAVMSCTWQLDGMA